MAGIDVCIILEEIADIMEIVGDNPHKIRAYRNAARSILRLDENLEDIWQANKLKSIPGIGEALASQIDEILRTGSSSLHRELTDRIPPGVLEMLSIPGLGPRTVSVIYQYTGIDNIKDLVKAAEDKKLRQLPGLGAKSEYNIVKGVELLSGVAGKVTLGVARPFALELAEYLQLDPLVAAAEPVGSIRRCKPLVSDLDILVGSVNEEAVRNRVRNYRRIKQITRDEPGNIGGYLLLDLPFEVIIVSPEDYYRALVWCTGSKTHRQQLLDFGLSIAQSGTHYLNEASVYAQIGLPYIYPELREGRGELEAAGKSSLPVLVELEDLRGDLHLHTDWSDGADKLADVVNTAQQLNYEYLAITDHSQSLAISHGLSPERLRLQHIEIDKLAESSDVKILKGSEVDILKDGRLDFDDDLLEQLDVVIASIHSNFKLGSEQQTARIEAAMKNPQVDMIGHMTGRLLNRRPGYELDTDYLLKLAAQTDTALEINSHPDRLDIGEDLAAQCRLLGNKIAINSDAHQVADMDLTWYGIKAARRAWLEKEQIINTWPFDKLEKWLRNGDRPNLGKE